MCRDGCGVMAQNFVACRDRIIYELFGYETGTYSGSASMAEIAL